MSRALLLVAAVALAAGCSRTTISVVTEAPPGRTAALDVESGTLRLTRGLAVVLACSEFDEGYSGPCRSLDVSVDGDDVVDVFGVHGDAGGASVAGVNDAADEGLVAPAQKSAVLLAAREAGEATVTLSPTATPVTLSLIVEEPPQED